MTISFAPFVPTAVLVVLAALSLALIAWALVVHQRGAVVRAGALAALLLALANPISNLEDRAPVKSIVAVVVDRSPSQSLADRTARTDAVLKALSERLSRFPGFETRVIEAVTDPDAESPSTRLYEALSNGIRDIPTSRLAGAVFITDGQVHDLPTAAVAAGLGVPLHGLVVGEADEADRRIEIVRAPRFGIVGEEQEIVYRVLVDGPGDRAPAAVSVRVNGIETGRATAVPGAESSYRFEVPRGGTNIVEFAVDDMDGEISRANNRAVAEVEGIRENLRVLLVSGEPHAGERAWRNLLKSDASVDLVHFTILRPPEKQDGTPINELSLIAFPTRELFIEKIDEFDLIIFDRYQNRGVLPVLYFDYIARYVEKGGALLIAAGPEFAGMESIADTPLAPALPAIPTSVVDSQGFYPRLTDAGKRHPVTRDLPGSASEPPQWGRWFRAIGVADVVGAAPRPQPLRRGPHRHASLRSRLAVGARLRKRRPARAALPPRRPLADAGALARGRGAARRGERPQARRRTPDDGRRGRAGDAEAAFRRHTGDRARARRGRPLPRRADARRIRPRRGDGRRADRACPCRGSRRT